MLRVVCACRSVELAYQRVPGVVQTAVGYSQGRVPNVTYEQVTCPRSCSSCCPVAGASAGHLAVMLVAHQRTTMRYVVCMLPGRCARATRGTTRWCRWCMTPHR